MRAPTAALIAARVAKGWTTERAQSVPAPGRPQRTENRSSVSHRHRIGPNGETIAWWEAVIRTAGGGRIYLRAYPTWNEADAACEHYLETGVKPPRKAGYHFQHTNPRPARRGPTAVKQRAAAPQIDRNAASADRLAMIRAAWRRTA